MYQICHFIHTICYIGTFISSSTPYSLILSISFVQYLFIHSFLHSLHSQNPASGPAYPQTQPAHSRENNGQQGVGWSPLPLLRQASGGTQADGTFCLWHFHLFHTHSFIYSFILPSLQSVVGLGKVKLWKSWSDTYNWKTRRESFNFWDLVQLILQVWQFV